MLYFLKQLSSPSGVPEESMLSLYWVLVFRTDCWEASVYPWSLLSGGIRLTGV